MGVHLDEPGHHVHPLAVDDLVAGGALEVLAVAGGVDRVHRDHVDDDAVLDHDVDRSLGGMARLVPGVPRPEITIAPRITRRLTRSPLIVPIGSDGGPSFAVAKISGVPWATAAAGRRAKRGDGQQAAERHGEPRVGGCYRPMSACGGGRVKGSLDFRPPPVDHQFHDSHHRPHPHVHHVHVHVHVASATRARWRALVGHRRRQVDDAPRSLRGSGRSAFQGLTIRERNEERSDAESLPSPPRVPDHATHRHLSRASRLVQAALRRARPARPSLRAPRRGGARYDPSEHDVRIRSS